MQTDLPVAVVIVRWQDMMSCNGNDHTQHIPVREDDYVDAILDEVHQTDGDDGWEIFGIDVRWILPNPDEEVDYREHFRRLVTQIGV